MGIYNPLYNEETGWAALDQLTPEQQAFMNPAPFGSGYGMNVGAANNPTNTYSQFTGYQGGSQLPAGYDPYSVSNGVAGMNFQFPSGSNLGGGGDNWITQNFTTPNNTVSPGGTLTPTSSGNSSGGGSTPVIGSPSLAPTGAQVAQNPGQYAGTSFDPTRNLMSGSNFPTGGANNMGMQGAQNVGGVGMYTGANAPLNMSLFAPQGQDAAIMQGSMGGLGEMLYKAAQQGGLNPNTSYLGFIDDLSRRALAAKGGQGGLLPQDFVNYMNSQAGQQWFQGMRTPAASQPPGTPTGSPVIQQTGPQNPPVAPLPGGSKGRPSGFEGSSGAITQPGPNAGPMQIAGNAMLNNAITGGNRYVDNSNYGGPQVDPARDYGDSLAGMQQQERVRQAMRSLGISEYGPELTPQQIQQLTQRLGYNPVTNWRGNAGGQQTPVIGSPGMINQRGTVSPNDPVNSPEAVQERLAWAARQQQQSQPDWNSLTDYGRQQLGMPTAAQWAQMQGGQQAQPQYGQQQDFRAATYGTQPQTPAPAGGSGNIPNTTNPLNPLTSQQQYAAPGWGSATNRRSGFGNTSLFGTPYGSGGSTGFGGTNPSQYRGAGIYGRPASYGQSQRPY